MITEEEARPRIREAIKVVGGLQHIDGVAVLLTALTIVIRKAPPEQQEGLWSGVVLGAAPHAFPELADAIAQDAREQQTEH